MAGTLFPLSFIVLFSVVGMIGTPIIWLLKKGGTDINYLEPFITFGDDFEKNKNIFRDHFIGVTIYLWGAFAIVYDYIKTGKVFTGD